MRPRIARNGFLIYGNICYLQAFHTLTQPTGAADRVTVLFTTLKIGQRTREYGGILHLWKLTGDGVTFLINFYILIC